MKKAKPYILPAAIVLGLVFHTWVAAASVVIPYVIFTILLLNFSAVDLRGLKFNRLDLRVMVFQTVVSLGGYLLLKFFDETEVLAQGWLICILCPVASSVVVVASSLGADRRTTTGYTIYGNLLVAVVAPVFFGFIGENQDMPLLQSMGLIFSRIAPVIALPFFIAAGLQIALPKVKAGLARFKEWAFPLWAVALLVTLGKTIDYIFLYHEGNELVIVLLGVMAVVACVLQFYAGRIMGRKSGEVISGAQLTGQKNTAMGIWMASVYLLPLSSVVLAFYSIAQNLWNSWQIWRKEHPKTLKSL